MNTVFIIGAGASKEARLPTGIELKENISHLLTPTTKTKPITPPEKLNLNLAIQLLPQYFDVDEPHNNTLFIKSKMISNGLPYSSSIDNFIYNHRDDILISVIGKLAITQTILDAESKSSLMINEGISALEIMDIKNTWHLPFYHTLTENCNIDDLENRLKSITLIIFNYDRCIEHFLFNAIKTHLNASEEKAASLLKSLNIYHPYGKVGSLPWESDENSFKFGGKPSPKELIELSKQIRTFTEGTDPSSEIGQIRDALINAHKIIFLGFAFLPLNMKLLAPNTIPNYHPKCYATAYNISPYDQDEIKILYNNMFRPHGGSVNLRNNIIMTDETCHNFFNKFKLSLSFPP